MFRLLLIVLLLLSLIHCGEEQVEKKEPEKFVQTKKKEPKGTKLDEGPPYTKLTKFKKPKEATVETAGLGKEKVYLSYYWESIDHWAQKDHIAKESDQYKWPFPSNRYRLWFGLYNMYNYPVLVEFEAHIYTNKKKLRYGSFKLKPKSGWSSRNMRRLYAQMQWGFNNKPNFYKLVVRVQRLDKNGNPYLAQGEKVPPYMQDQINDSLWAAIRFLNVKKVQNALGKGADVNTRGTYARTPLISLTAQNWRGNKAVLAKQVEIAKILLKEGAKVNDSDKDGATPLHWASKNANVDIVELLLRAKAEINALDKRKRTPLDYAIIEQEKYMRQDYNNIISIDGSESRNNFWYSQLGKTIFVLKRLGGKTRFQKKSILQ